MNSCIANCLLPIILYKRGYELNWESACLARRRFAVRARITPQILPSVMTGGSLIQMFPVTGSMDELFIDNSEV